MKCYICHVDVPPAWIYCEHCGTQLHEKIKITPKMTKSAGVKQPAADFKQIQEKYITKKQYKTITPKIARTNSIEEPSLLHHIQHTEAMVQFLENQNNIVNNQKKISYEKNIIISRKHHKKKLSDVKSHLNHLPTILDKIQDSNSEYQHRAKTSLHVKKNGVIAEQLYADGFDSFWGSTIEANDNNLISGSLFWGSTISNEAFENDVEVIDNLEDMNDGLNNPSSANNNNSALNINTDCEEGAGDMKNEITEAYSRDNVNNSTTKATMEAELTNDFPSQINDKNNDNNIDGYNGGNIDVREEDVNSFKQYHININQNYEKMFQLMNYCIRDLNPLVVLYPDPLLQSQPLRIYRNMYIRILSIIKECNNLHNEISELIEKCYKYHITYRQNISIKIMELSKKMLLIYDSYNKRYNNVINGYPEYYNNDTVDNGVNGMICQLQLEDKGIHELLHTTSLTKQHMESIVNSHNNKYLNKNVHIITDSYLIQQNIDKFMLEANSELRQYKHQYDQLTVEESNIILQLK
jgi:hypothetical protein